MPSPHSSAARSRSSPARGPVPRPPTSRRVPNTITATETNAAGTSDSIPDTFTITSIAPSPAPTITAPANGSTVTTNRPVITGTGTTGDTITVRNALAALVCGPVTVVAGTWTCTPTTNQPQGPNTITATETNSSGSTPSAPDTFTITSIAPSPAPTITAPANGSTVTTNRPVITGTGTTGDTITVRNALAAIVCGPVTVTAGTWSCTPATNQPEGSTTVIATETNAAGSTPSAPDTFIVASAIVPPPVITSPTDGSTINNGTVAFTGTGVAGDTVTVTESGQTLCSAVVNSSSNWNCSPVVGLTLGAHTVVATQQDPVTTTMSGPSNMVTFTTAVIGTRYVPKTPYRVMDTRPTMQVGLTAGPIAAGHSVTLSAGQLRIAAGTASAVVVNLTVTESTQAGYVTAYPSSQTRPAVSSLNFAKGQVRANLVIVPVAADGSVTIYTIAPTQIVVDVFGYFSTSLVTTSGGLFHSLQPARLLDTRLNGNTPLSGGETRSLVVTGRGGVPSAGVSAVVLNVTVSRPTAGGYVSAFPTGAVRSTSSVNFMPGDLASTRVIVPIGAGGSVSFFNYDGSTALVVDVTGYFTTTSGGDLSGAQFVAVNPTRVIDSRIGMATPQGALQPGEVRTVQLAGGASIPVNGTVAVVANVTAANPTQGGYLTQYPTTTAKPVASDVNFIAHDIVANLSIAGVDTSGRSSVYNYGGPTDLIEDVTGYFQGGLT